MVTLTAQIVRNHATPVGSAERGDLGGLDGVAERLEELGGVGDGRDAIGVRVDDLALGREAASLEPDPERRRALPLRPPLRAS